MGLLKKSTGPHTMQQTKFSSSENAGIGLAIRVAKRA